MQTGYLIWLIGRYDTKIRESYNIISLAWSADSLSA